MKEVSKEEFFKVINPLDAVVKSYKNENGHYSTDFNLRHGGFIGKIEEVDYSNKKYLLK